MHSNKIYTDQRDRIIFLESEIMQARLALFNTKMAYDSCREEVFQGNLLNDKLEENNYNYKAIIRQKDVQIKAITGVGALLILYNIIQIIKQ